MNVKHCFGLTILFLFALSACASKPPAEKSALAKYGPPPTDYQQIIKDYYEGFLSDFESADYQWLEPPYPGHIFYS